MQHIPSQKKPWKVQIRNAQGKMLTQSFLTKEDAREFENRIIRERSCHAAGIEVAPEEMLFKKLAQIYVHRKRANPDIAVSTVRTLEDRIRVHLLEKFGDLPLTRITTTMIAEHLDSLMVPDPDSANPARRRGLSGATRNRILATIRNIYNCAVKWKYAKDNPAQGIEEYSEKKKTRKTSYYESEEEIEKYIAGAFELGLVYGLFATLQFFAGGRICETLALQWQDIDEKGDLIWVRRIQDKHDGNKIKERTKGQGDGGEYYLLLLPRVMEALEAWRKSTPHTKRTDFILHDTEGKPLNQGMIRNVHARVIRDQALKRITIHDMRRTFASHAQDAGFAREDLQTMLGHEHMSTTQTYVRPSQTRLVDKAKRLDFGKIKQGG